jgi:hypothetical protein
MTTVDLLLGMWCGSEGGGQQLLDDLIDPSFRHRFGDAPSQMGLQDVSADPV